MWNAADDSANFQRNFSTGEVEIDGSTLYLALAAIDYGGPAVETRAFASYLLLRVGRNAEAARLCREGLDLSPERQDLRRNLAVAEARLTASRQKTPASTAP